jgi:hypothetical protein
MTLPKPKLPPLPRAGLKSAGAASRPPAAPSGEEPPQPAREPDQHGASEPADFGWRASSYDLKQGLDVVELPTSLPPEVLERLFKAPKP